MRPSRAATRASTSSTSASPARRVVEECRRDQWGWVSKRLSAGQTAGHTVPFIPPRFMRIFEARPGYPFFLVPFITVLGVKWGLWMLSVLITVAGVLAFLVLRTLRAPTVASRTRTGPLLRRRAARPPYDPWPRACC